MPAVCRLCADCERPLCQRCVDVVCANGVLSAHCVPMLRGCCAEYPWDVCRRCADVSYSNDQVPIIDSVKIKMLEDQLKNINASDHKTNCIRMIYKRTEKK